MPDANEIVLAISDTQFPFHQKDTFDFLGAVAEKYQPTRVIHIGDMLDFHALSDYDHDPDGDSAGVEFKKAMRSVYRLYQQFPEVQVCLSNHDARPYRKAFKHGIPNGFMKTYREMLDAPPGWEWGQSFEIDGVVYEHGEGISGRFAHLHAAERNMRSTVMGHLHTNAGIEYVANSKHLIFGMATGCLIDTDAYAFAYGKHERRKPIISVGVVDKGIPIIVPMLLKRGGRWVGKL